MKSFKLYVYKNESYRILLTQFNAIQPAQNSLYSTFNEKLDFAEHDQLTLTFSLMKYIDRFDHRHTNNSTIEEKRLENQFHKLLQMGSKIELVLDHSDKYIFIINKIQPVITKSNIQFNYTCQDEVSYGWSRRNLGMSYSTVELGGVRTIYEITTEVFKQANIVDWRAIPDELNETDDGLLSARKITLEVEDSNPYNIIIEACNSLNAYMKVNWTRKIISFYQKDKIKFSGYRYRPEVNLKSLGVDFDMDEMSTIMHVYGGTDENDQIISLMPALPDGVARWWKDYHTYYKNKRFNLSNMNFTYLLEKNGVLGYGYSGSPLQMINTQIYCRITNPTSNNITVYLKVEDQNNNTYILFDGTIAPESIKNIRANLSGFVGPLTVTKDSQALYYFLTTALPANAIISTSALNDFIRLSEKNPCLGNFLYNFDFFENNHTLSTNEKQEILDILEIKMAYNNMWLKYYEPAYWRSYSYLYLYIQEAKAILENLQAARLNPDNGVENGDVAKISRQYKDKIEDIKNLIKSLYNSNIIRNHITDGIPREVFDNNIEMLQSLVNEYHTYLNLLLESKSYINSYEQNNGDEYEISLQEAELAYYKSQYFNLRSVVGAGHGNYWYYSKFNNETDEDDKLPDEYMATYPQLILDLYNAILESDDKNTETIYDKVNYYKQENDTLWTNLYQKYGQYIYESKYENLDELDSVSLFNQAIDYYEDYNKPTANYSISILDLSVLEAIDTPRLAVGSKIKVYNNELNLNEKNSSSASEPLNNIQYTNNDLVVTSLNFDLRKSGEVSISVEKVSSYQSILQKLIKSIN